MAYPLEGDSELMDWMYGNLPQKARLIDVSGGLSLGRVGHVWFQIIVQVSKENLL